jgi:ABC-type lipoprotein export system ATPase subunit
VVIGGRGSSPEHSPQTSTCELRRRRVGYIFQQYNLIPHLHVTANIELPQQLAGASRGAARTRSIELLEALGRTARQGNMPGTLSVASRSKWPFAQSSLNV